MKQKYCELLYYFMKYLNPIVLNENKEYLTGTLRRKAEGLIKPAALLVKAGSPRSSEILWLYKTCINNAAHLILVTSGEEINIQQWFDKIYEEQFVEVIDKCYASVLAFLRKAGTFEYLGALEYFGALEHFDLQKIKIARWCEDFRNDFSLFENMVKEEYLIGMPFYQKEFDFKQGVLVRSVPGLDLCYGHWGVNYPILSTSIFSTDNPEWYLKELRNIMLLYRIFSPDDVLAMFCTDGSTYCHYLPFADPRLAATPGFYVDKLLIDDGPKKGFIASMGPWYQCAYPYSQLIESNLCEIVLDSSVHPEGILIGDLEVYHNSKLVESTEAFARYYKLPVYAFVNGDVKLFQPYKK